MTNAYVDCFDYLRAPSGLETASLVGNTFRLPASHLAGVTALTVSSNAVLVPLKQYDRLTIFDGPNTEVVSCNASVAVGATSIPLLTGTSTQYAHAANIAVCSDGVLGSLADEIVAASAWAENICSQSLFQATYTNETLRIPSMRGSLDNQGMLIFRPRHWPVTAITGLTIKNNQAIATSYDATQAIIDGGQIAISVPWLTTSGGGGSTYSVLTRISRQTNLWLSITYTAGYAPASLPGDIKEAVILLTSDILSRRQNPTGGFLIQLEHKRIQTGAATDTSGNSELVKRAVNILQYYSAEAF